eukprot:COSAG01_NODE_31391_length_598_cov_2.296593_1_plen_92_part_10
MPPYFGSLGATTPPATNGFDETGVFFYFNFVFDPSTVAGGFFSLCINWVTEVSRAIYEYLGKKGQYTVRIAWPLLNRALGVAITRTGSSSHY